MKRVAVVLTSLSLLLISISGIVEFEGSIYRNFISESVYGQYGRLITAGFYFLGIGGFAFLLDHFPVYRTISVGVVLIVLVTIWSLSLGLIAAFPVDSGTNDTIYGTIHSIFATAAFSSAFLIIILHSFFSNKGVLTISRISSILLATIVLAGMLLIVFGNDKYAGIYQRMIIFPEIVWFIMIEMNLDRVLLDKTISIAQ